MPQLLTKHNHIFFYSAKLSWFKFKLSLIVAKT